VGKNIDLQTQFQDWLDEQQGFQLRSDRLHDDLKYIDQVSDEGRMEIVAKWLQAAYLAGARCMAQDTVDTLGDYGTALAGCETPVRNPTECYDAARDNLMVYYTKVLDDAENSLPNRS